MKNILLIGASSGIGKATAEKLSQHHRVYGSFNSNPSTHNDIHYFKYNVLEDELNLEELPDVIHGLVYCPGAIHLLPFKRISEDQFLDDYRLQVTGAVKTIQRILPRLRKAENASIVLFSTVAVQSGFNFHTLVAASKGAIEGLTRSLAAEFAPKIRVNAIAPSLTDTPLAGKLLSTESKKESNAARHPMKRIGTENDMANAVAYLLFEESSWMTGQILKVDGGISSIKM
jgi:NAD(P)-dependent dehydrogenase (short-subunit alcohol dehydrogenase family)